MFLNCHLKVFFFCKSFPKRPWNKKGIFWKIQCFLWSRDLCHWKLWLHWFAYRLCLKLFFQLIVFVKEILPSLVQKTLVDHVQPTLNGCLSITCTFQHSPLTFAFWKVHMMYSILWCPIFGSLSMSTMSYLKQLIHLV